MFLMVNVEPSSCTGCCCWDLVWRVGGSITPVRFTTTVLTWGYEHAINSPTACAYRPIRSIDLL